MQCTYHSYLTCWHIGCYSKWHAKSASYALGGLGAPPELRDFSALPYTLFCSPDFHIFHINPHGESGLSWKGVGSHTREGGISGNELGPIHPIAIQKIVNAVRKNGTVQNQSLDTCQGGATVRLPRVHS
jgi:hypothetical protein